MAFFAVITKNSSEQRDTLVGVFDSSDYTVDWIYQSDLPRYLAHTKIYGVNVELSKNYREIIATVQGGEQLFMSRYRNLSRERLIKQWNSDVKIVNEILELKNRGDIKGLSRFCDIMVDTNYATSMLATIGINPAQALDIAENSYIEMYNKDAEMSLSAFQEYMRNRV